MRRADMGYILTAGEIKVLLGGLGINDLKGLPFTSSAPDGESEMAAVRSLLHRGVIRKAGECYSVNEPFRKAALILGKSRYVFTIASKNYSSLSYVIYKIKGEISVWEFNINFPERAALSISDINSFTDKLFDDGFIPETAEYSDAVPDGYGREVKLSAEKFSQTGESASPKIYTLIRRTDYEDGGESAYLTLACGKYGSIISEITDTEVINKPYSHKNMKREIVRFFREQEI